eukprot:811204_1
MAQSTEIRISNDDRSNWNIISKHITIVQLDSPEHKVTLVICQKSDQEGIFKLITKQRPPYAFQPKALIIRHHHYHARDFHQKYHFIIFSQKNFASKFKKFQLKTEDISRDVLNFRPSTMKPIQMEFDQKYNLKAIDIVLHHRTISECLIVVYNLQRVISAMTLIAAIPSVAAMSVKLSRKSKHEVSFEEIFSIIVQETDHHLISTMDCMQILQLEVNFKNVSIEPLTSFASTVTSLIDSMATPFNVSVPMYLTAMIRAFTFGGASRAKEKSLLTILSDLAASRVENIQRIDYLRKVCTSNNDKSFLWGM